MNFWSKLNLDVETTIIHEQLLLKLLNSIRLFEGFSKLELLDFLSGAEKRVYRISERILNEGEPGGFMYVIIAGSVEIHKSSSQGGEAVLAQLEAGECFGEMALVDRQMRSASVIALSDCTLLRVGPACLLQIPESSAKFYRNIAFLLSKRLRQTNVMISLGLADTEPATEQVDQPASAVSRAASA